MADDDDGSSDASSVSLNEDDVTGASRGLSISGARPASPPGAEFWDFPPRPTSIDVVPPVGNVSPPPRKVLSDSNKESMYMGNCLMGAVRLGDEEEVKHWLRAGRSLGLAVTMDIKTGKSTLHFAAELGFVKIAQFLLDAGVRASFWERVQLVPLQPL